MSRCLMPRSTRSLERREAASSFARRRCFSRRPPASPRPGADAFVTNSKRAATGAADPAPTLSYSKRPRRGGGGHESGQAASPESRRRRWGPAKRPVRRRSVRQRSRRGRRPKRQRGERERVRASPADGYAAPPRPRARPRRDFDGSSGTVAFSRRPVMADALRMPGRVPRARAGRARYATSRHEQLRDVAGGLVPVSGRRARTRLARRSASWASAARRSARARRPRSARRPARSGSRRTSRSWTAATSRRSSSPTPTT